MMAKLVVFIIMNNRKSEVSNPLFRQGRCPYNPIYFFLLDQEKVNKKKSRLRSLRSKNYVRSG